MFYPFHSWGLELPNQESINMKDIRGENPDDTILVLHPEGMERLAKALDEDGTFNPDKYAKALMAEKASQTKF